MVPEDEVGPGFAYTIGLAHTYGAPELSTFGRDVHEMHRMLNVLGDLAGAGASLEDGREHRGVLDGGPVRLRSVDTRWYRTFFGRATRIYQRPRSRSCRCPGPTRVGAATGRSRPAGTTRRHSPACGWRPTTNPWGSGPSNSEVARPQLVLRRCFFWRDRSLNRA
ncbi:DUF4262 domain-containing protein [Streptomyces nojiriensis]|nr:DUF4262 domain-containing protein [Streptomyces nojiriensis]